jgi:hypothetical protein
VSGDEFDRALAFAAATWSVSTWDADIYPFRAVVSLWRGEQARRERERLAPQDSQEDPSDVPTDHDHSPTR